MNPEKNNDSASTASSLQPAASGHLFHICRVWGSHHGGSLYSQVLIEELLKRGWSVTLVAEQFVEAPSALKRMSLHDFFRGGFLAAPGRLAELLRLWKLITGTPRALVLVQGDLPRLTYLLLQLWVPLIFIRQDGILTCPGNHRFQPRSRSVCRKGLGASCLRVHRREGCLGSLSFLRQVGRLVFRVRDKLLLRWIRYFVANSFYAARAHHKPGYVLYPPHRSAPTRCADFERDLHRLVFCGRLEQVKGAAEAIRILSLLPAAFYLELLGDGPERERLGKLVADLQLSARVRFRGWVDALTRDRCLASAGLLLMPSLWDEAFGMAGLEALAQGTPVVAYDVGGISEWCRGDAGILVPCGDVLGAAVAVRRLVNDPIRWTACSSAARRVAELEFPATRFARDLDELCARVRQVKSHDSVIVANFWAKLSRNTVWHGSKPL